MYILSNKEPKYWQSSALSKYFKGSWLSFTFFTNKAMFVCVILPSEICRLCSNKLLHNTDQAWEVVCVQTISDVLICRYLEKKKELKGINP